MGVPKAVKVDPAKSTRIQQVLAAAPAGPPISEKVRAGKPGRRQQLAQALQREAGAGTLDDALEGDEGFEQDPDDQGELEDPDAPDLPDLEETLGAETPRGGRASRPRQAQALPESLQPRQVEQVIRDPRVGAMMRARAERNGHDHSESARLDKGTSWGRRQDEEFARAEEEGAEQLPEGARTIELSDRHRRALESLLDEPLTNSGDILRAVTKLTENQVAGISIKLTPAERAEIVKRAKYNRRTPEQEFEAAWTFIKPLVFAASVALTGTTEISGKGGR